MAADRRTSQRAVFSNGRYSVLITAGGGGVSTWDGLALTAGSDDAEQGGVLVYLRDLDAGHLWSAATRPVGASGGRYRASRAGDVFRIERIDGDVDTAMSVAVSRDADVEIRRVRLRNRSRRRRRIEVTTFAEIVLNEPAAHAAHPAFSKLFVQTEIAGDVLLAHRRPRAEGERTPWMMHALLGPGELNYETDRARFLGRGRGADRPRALDRGGELSGTVGSVLDPLFALRRTLLLAPGGSAEVDLVLGAAADRRGALDLARRFSDRGVIERALHGSEAAPKGLVLSSGKAVVRPALATVRRRTNVRDAARRARFQQDLLFSNGYGGFSLDGTEYVIRLDPSERSAPRRPPMPWVNVIANEKFGFLVSESGAGATWSRNSRLNRITPWCNDPIVDPHGEALEVKDEESGDSWSPTPGPIPAPEPYEVRHGFGYTSWRVESRGLAIETVTFAARSDPVRATQVRVRNVHPRRRRLSLSCNYELVLGVLPSEAGSVASEQDPETKTILATNPANGELSEGVVFVAAHAPVASAARSQLSRKGQKPSAKQIVRLDLAAGATAEVFFLLGEATSRAGAREIVSRYDAAQRERSLGEVRSFWSETLSNVQAHTPRRALDLMLNGWLGYQNLSCRIWGRTAFYQSGGAFGFRDQLQDAAALVYLRPDLTRAQILLHAAHQFAEGDVLHWWHPPIERGIRTRFSDDLLWLPYLTAFYARTTGDAGVLDERVDFVRARSLEPGEDEAYLSPEPCDDPADVYDHCCRAIDRSLTEGAHGLPLMGTGDWNDGMNRVGRQGRGESVWLGFFLYAVIGDFLPFVDRRGDGERARRYRRYREHLRAALNDGGWDGAWYRRAYYDDGTPLGSAANDECRIDALVQAWAVISGAAPRDRADMAMDAVERELISSRDGLIRLLAPPFDKTSHDPGYIKGYVPGIRENGGQYTHAALWVIRALAELGRRDRAAELLEKIGPVWHARNPEAVATYQVEPYVVAADIYGSPPHVGRGGWTWYTGSAGWMYRVALESILGVTIENGSHLVIAPRIPDAWPEYRLDYRPPGRGDSYDITVRNPSGAAETVVAASIDGHAQPLHDGGARIALRDDASSHRVVVTLGNRDQLARGGG